LTVNVWAFYRITGGQFNPAVRLTTHSLIYFCLILLRLHLLFALLVDCPLSVGV